MTLRVPIGAPPTVNVGTFTDSVNTTIDLSAYNGMGLIYVTVTAVDSFNASSNDDRGVYVETSPYLTPVYSTDNNITDFNNNRALSFNYPSQTMPKIGDVTNGTVTTIPFSGTVGGVLFSNQGAVISAQPAGQSNTYLYNWYNGNFDSLTSTFGISNLQVNGNYCVWNFNSYLYFRNLATQTTQFAGNGTWNDVAASGVGTYYRSNSNYDSILLYQNGSAAGVSSNSNGYVLTNPVTDGKNVAYVQLDLHNNQSIYRYDAKTGTNSFLSSLTNSPLPPGPFYLVNNGYTTFLNPDASGRYQAWVRDTMGNLIQASPFSLSSTLERLSSNGQLSFLNGSVNPAGLRYIYDPRSAGLVNVSSAMGKPYWQDLDSSWYIALGNTLFRVNLNITPDKSDSFAVTVKEDSLYNFSANDFASHYHTSGTLLTVTFSKLPAHGSLILNGTNITLNQSIPRSGLSKLAYKPLLNFTGNDTAIWIGSNGYTAAPSALLVINVDSVLPTLPPAPQISGLNAGYCSNYGMQVNFSVTNMPAVGTGTTVAAALDGQPLAITAGGAMSIKPWTMTVGSHTVTVIFSNSVGADTARDVFQIAPASTPIVKVVPRTDTVTSSTQQVMLTATDVSGGGTAPLFTFSTDRSFNSNILQGPGSDTSMTIAVSSLAYGDNIIYVRMQTSDSCFTSPIGVDTVDLVRVADTLPSKPRIGGLEATYCHSAGAQQISISNMPSSGSGVTVTGTLDGQAVNIPTAGTITLQPQNLSVGVHTVAVVFTNSTGTDSTHALFQIVPVVTPAVKLTTNLTLITASTTSIELIATDLSAGATTPLYTFARDAGFTNIVRTQGQADSATVAVSTLAPGNNVFYVKMQIGDSCVSSSTATDSIVVVMPADTSGSTQGGHVMLGPNPFTGNVIISNLQSNKSYGIALANSSGQVLITQVVQGQTQAVLLTSDLLRGVYFLRVYDLGNGKTVKTAILLSANR